MFAISVLDVSSNNFTGQPKGKDARSELTATWCKAAACGFKCCEQLPVPNERTHDQQPSACHDIFVGAPH